MNLPGHITIAQRAWFPGGFTLSDVRAEGLECIVTCAHCCATFRVDSLL